MRFHWTAESFGYALRDQRNYARALITTPGPHQGFYGCILESGLPDSGPYKSRQEAANWVAHILIHQEIAPADSTFSLLPGVEKRAA